MRQGIFVCLYIHGLHKRKLNGLSSRLFLHGDVEYLFCHVIRHIQILAFEGGRNHCFSATLISVVVSLKTFHLPVGVYILPVELKIIAC